MIFTPSLALLQVPGEAILKFMLKNLVRRGLRSVGYDLAHATNTLWGHLDILFRSKQINCVIDVGAHFGEYGHSLRGLGYKGQIHSFEPVSASFAKLQESAKDDPKWATHHCALGRQEQQLPINVSRHSVFSSFLSLSDFSRNEFAADTCVVEKEHVLMRALKDLFDTCVAGISSPKVFLKLDTQGYDLEVLAGAGDHINHIVALQIELPFLHCYSESQSFATSLARVQEYGFDISGFFPVTYTRDLRLVEVDCVMIRSEAEPRPQLSSNGI